MVRRLALVQEIAVDIVLEDEARGVEPVIEYLAAHYVPAYAPAVLVAVLPEPVVAQHLGVEIMRLEGGVVHVILGAFEEEETVMVYKLIASVQAEKGCDVYIVVVVHELSRVSATPCQLRERKGGGEERLGMDVYTSLGKKLKYLV